MNKNAIKEYAIWARRELIDRVSQKAFEYGIEKDQIEEVKGDTVKGIVLSRREKDARNKLVSEINKKGFDQVMEETAYTWFNRFTALRFMEVNNYLPQRVRPFIDEENKFNPQIINDALDLDFVDKNAIYSYKDINDTDGLYKYLLIALCNDMNQYLPGMFETIDDYRVLLFPDNLLRDGSVVARLITDIDEDSWNDQVQIIGWLYQYYISERHEEVIDPLHAKVIMKEDLPAATQLFTPDWIVKYMTENSLGRLWLDGHKNTEIKKNWNYYLDEADQEPEIEKQLAEIRLEHSHITPEDIKFFDPCMGSGHILVYAFDVLMQIYTSEGWTERDAAKAILKNNIYGLDIDERAYQLSYFALMMKARQYNRRILNEGIIPNVMAIEESNEFDRKPLHYFKELEPLATRVVDIFYDAKEYGSILNVNFTREELDSLANKLEEIEKNADYGDLLEQAEINTLINNFETLMRQAIIMSQKYECVVTNPPYLNKMDSKLKSYVFKFYKDYSSDLFSVFIKKNLSFAKENAYISFMTPNVWMFIKSYEKLRDYIIDNKNISSLIQLAKGSFFKEATVDICSFTLVNNNINSKGIYVRLENFKGDLEVQNQKVREAINNRKVNYLYASNKSNYKKIQGHPIAFWWSNFSIFESKQICNYYESAGRNKTHDNNLYVRKWWEINNYIKWQPYANGGEFRRWRGNDLDLVDWSDEAKEKYASHGGLYNQKYNGKRGICWNLITSYKNGFRIKHSSHHYSSGAPTIISIDKEYDNYVLAFLNGKVAECILQMFNPTLNTTVGDVLKLPLIIDNESEVGQISEELQNESQEDWDSFEYSAKFRKHPLIQGTKTVNKAFEIWSNECDKRFDTMKHNEERLNSIFISTYGLQNELTSEVLDRDVTVRRSDLTRDIKSLISYAVGCIFGRFSLDTEGLVYVEGKLDLCKYKTFIPDTDNIVPICDDEYFADDIVNKFIEFVSVVYGQETLEENLQFIADALGGKGTSREIIRYYFVNDFFNDHAKIYQKRPIYWQFESGKKNGFKALIYVHRYTPDLLAKMRTDYVHEMQERYRTQIQNLESHIDGLSGSEKVKANKELAKYKDQLSEISTFEEKLHHLADQMISIDLDDGFKQNYPKFEGVVTKVK